MYRESILWGQHACTKDKSGDKMNVKSVWGQNVHIHTDDQCIGRPDGDMMYV